MKCPKCDSEMTKSGKMNSGNATYDVFKCPNCSEEKIVAVGLN